MPKATSRRIRTCTGSDETPPAKGAVKKSGIDRLELALLGSLDRRRLRTAQRNCRETVLGNRGGGQLKLLDQFLEQGGRRTDVLQFEDEAPVRNRRALGSVVEGQVMERRRAEIVVDRQADCAAIRRGDTGRTEIGNLADRLQRPRHQ